MNGETTTGFRLNFRIRPDDDLADELERLARVISVKYKRDVKIYLEEVGR